MNQKPVILIVDDVPVNVQALAVLLSDEYFVKVATSGGKAIELANQDPSPDLILLDVEMPEMDGHQVCGLLKSMPKTANIPVIFVTAKDTEVDEEHGLELGAVDYIIKPFRPAIVKARVKTHVTLKQQHDRFAAIALKDQLTGLYNRHYLMEEGVARIAHAQRHQQDLSIVVVDIDHFKKINDTFGHLAGDRVLQHIARLIETNKRKEDIAARFGGEEFVLIMENCSLLHAGEKAEYLRQLIEASPIDGIQVTASFGTAQMQEGITDFEGILKNADDALYKAKESGRNRVHMYGEEHYG